MNTTVHVAFHISIPCHISISLPYIFKFKFKVYFTVYTKKEHNIDWLLFVGIMVRVFTNGSRNWGSILGQVISKTQKMVLDGYLFNTQHCKVQIISKWSNSKKGLVPSPTPQFCSYWIGSLWIAPDYGLSKTMLFVYLFLYFIGHFSFLLSSHINLKKKIGIEHY